MLRDAGGQKVVEISLPHTKYDPSGLLRYCTGEAFVEPCTPMMGCATDTVPLWRGRWALPKCYRKTRGRGFWAQRCQRRVLFGTYVLFRQGSYERVLQPRHRKVRTLIKKRDFETVFADGVDAI